MFRRTALDTPGGDSTSQNNPDFDNPDFTEASSFRSPGEDRNVLKAATGQKKISIATPRNREIFGNLTNRNGGTRKNEFTPLLRSVHKSAMKGKIDRKEPETPGFLRNLTSSPPLPHESAGNSYEDSNYTGGDNTAVQDQVLPSSSVNTTPAPVLGRGAGGALGGEGAMTLREQEKVIDEIKKENFSLKLKVFFLDERMQKMGPEFNDAALKEVSVNDWQVRAEWYC